jgi:two-component system nitrate/nitrite response regulator NarL
VSSHPIRLVIVHDQQVFHECLASALAQQRDFTVFGLSPGQGDLLENVRAYQPDILLIDVNIPAERALKLTAQISLELPHIKIIMLGLDGNDSTILKCVEAGASGCLPKENYLSDLVEMILAVLRGETVCSAGIAYSTFSRIAELARQNREQRTLESALLTIRELEILQLVADGLSNKQIAERLCVSLHTVKNHVHNILEKLKVRHRSEAGRYAHQSGLFGKVVQR